MGEHTPDRLKAFREENRERARSGGAWPVLHALLILAGFTAVIVTVVVTAKQDARVDPSGGLSHTALREYAAILEQKGLKEAALEAYQEYLAKAPLEPQIRANVCYSVGKLAIEAGQYEKALEMLYQAEMLDPDGPMKDDIGSKVVLCLDRMGRAGDLRRELRKRTVSSRTGEDLADGEVVLAEFGGQVITGRDLEREIEKLPPAARESFDSPEKRAELLEHFVAERLLLDRALRLELDKAPEVQDELARVRDGLIVRRLIEQEIDAKLSITPGDVRRFYEAELERFTEPAARVGIVGAGDSAEAAQAALDEARQDPETAARVMVRGDRLVQGLGSPDHDAVVRDALLSATSGTVSEPLRLGEMWYVFEVSETPAQVRAFEDVKAQAERMLRTEKQQEHFQAMMAETLEAQNVQLFPERLTRKPVQE